MIQKIQAVDRWLGRIEAYLLTIIILVMTLMACYQVVLRNLFSEALIWNDLLLRKLVLWIAGIGASLAVLESKHIRIDLVHYMGRTWMKVVAPIVSEFTAFLITSYMAWQAWIFLDQRTLMGGAGPLGIPNWAIEIILPIAFSTIAVRFLVRLTAHISSSRA